MKDTSMGTLVTATRFVIRMTWLFMRAQPKHS